ncbi:MAG: hypothetical protein ACOYJC_06820 [Christensenellales bacterium]|jgi:uncharacterized repeat protein (TIGR01451 family)
MKKILAGIVLIALVVCLTLGAIPVYAQGEVDIKAAIEPNELVQGGSVYLSITVANNTEETIGDVTISVVSGGGDLVGGTLGNIEAGGIKEFSQADYQVPDSALGGQLVFKVTWDDGAHSKNVSCDVKRKAVNPNLEFSRTPDKRVVAQGEAVVLTYVLQNVGDVRLDNISISDPAVGGTVQSGITLQVGDPAVTYSRTLTVNADVVSSPTVSYTAAGKPYEKSYDPITITMANSGLNLDLNIDNLEPKKGDTVKVTCDISNTGNVDISDIVVKDELGTNIKSGFVLKSGARTSITSSFTADETRRLTLVATGKDASGNTVEASSNMLTVTVGTQSDTFNVRLIVETDTSQLSPAGQAKFNITVANESDFTLQNVVISEDSLGEIAQEASMGKGTKKYTATADLEDGDSVFRFRLTCTDENGTEYSAYSESITVSATATTPTPTPAPGGSTTSTLLVILIIIIALIVICAVVFIILISQEKKAKKLAAQNAKRRSAVSDRMPNAAPGLQGTQDDDTSAKGPGAPGLETGQQHIGAKPVNPDYIVQKPQRLPNIVLGEEPEQPPLMQEEPSTLVEFGPGGLPIQKDGPQEEQEDADAFRPEEE